jgi:UDP-N-acetylglucosamine:LPS N-acetylglucosamine transferase
MIPISKEVSRDQESNAFSYARSGAAIVIRQKNLTKSILIHEIDRLFSDFEQMREMAKKAKEFYKEDAAIKIATAILDIELSHEV